MIEIGYNFYVTILTLIAIFCYPQMDEIQPSYHYTNYCKKVKRFKKQFYTGYNAIQVSRKTGDWYW